MKKVRIKMRKRKKKALMVRGSTTIEMAYLMPLILLVFLTVVHITFYFHDKSILNGIVCEAVTSGILFQRSEIGDPAELEVVYTERTHGKLIYFSAPEIQIRFSENSVSAECRADRGGMYIEIIRTAKSGHPEKRIRIKNRIEETGQ